MAALKSFKVKDTDVSGNPHILALDVGSTNVKCFLYNKEAEVVAVATEKMEILHPKPGYSELDPDDLWTKVEKVMKGVIEKSGVSVDLIKCMGITTQRNTFINWDKETGEYFHKFITWQDLRARKLVKNWNTSYTMSAFSNSTKVLHTFTRQTRFLAASVLRFMSGQVTMRLKWMIQNNEKLKKRIEEKQVQFGTIDTWLLWKLTNGRSVATDYSLASTTGMFDPFQVEWSGIVAGLVGLPMHILPPIKDTSGLFGHTDISLLGKEIPIMSVVADQQSALFGQCCFNVGDMNCSMGTGAFYDVMTGTKPHASVAGLFPLVGWKIGSEIMYVAEGYASDIGPILDWAQSMDFFQDVKDTAAIASSVPDSGGVCFVPGFSGIQAPINDDKACTSLIGITPKTTKPHIVRAVLEGIAFRVYLLHETVLKEIRVPLSNVCRVDGGVTNNDFIMKMVTDLTGCDLEKPHQTDMTPLGAAYLAGLAAGIWKDKEELKSLRKCQTTKPTEKFEKYKPLVEEWQRAMKRCMNWYPTDNE